MRVRPAIGAIVCITIASLLCLGSTSPPLATAATQASAAETPVPLAQIDLEAAPRTCSEIQSAIDGLPARGGEVVLRARTYNCSQPIVIAHDNVQLRGKGPSTVLFLADNANAPLLVIGDTSATPATTYHNIRVSDLAIDGNRTHQQHECWGGPCNSVARPIRNNGITLRGVQDVLVERVTVKSTRSGGLVTEKGSQRVTVREFTSYDNHFDGLAGYETEDSLFTGLHLHHNRSAGLSFDIRFNGNVFSDVIITDSGTVGVFMRDSRDNVFHGMQIRDSADHGIFLAQVDADASKPAAGNTFSAVFVSNSGGHGLRVNDESCVSNSAVGCQFIANGGRCISAAARVVRAGIICR